MLLNPYLVKIEDAEIISLDPITVEFRLNNGAILYESIEDRRLHGGIKKMRDGYIGGDPWQIHVMYEWEWRLVEKRMEELFQDELDGTLWI